jgi:homoserine acetyltransferase
MRDNVRAQHVLLAALGVRRVTMALGGSLGGTVVALEWAALFFRPRRLPRSHCRAPVQPLFWL